MTIDPLRDILQFHNGKEVSFWCTIDTISTLQVYKLDGHAERSKKALIINIMLDNRPDIIINYMWIAIKSKFVQSQMPGTPIHLKAKVWIYKKDNIETFNFYECKPYFTVKSYEC